MVSHLISLLTPPQFTDSEKTRVANLLYTILFILWVAAIIGLLIGWIFNWQPLTIGMGVSILITSFCIGLTRQGHIHVAGLMITLSLLLIMTAIAFFGRGIHAYSILTFTFTLVISSFILEKRPFILITVLAIIAAGFLTFSEMKGLIITPMSATVSLYDFVVVTVILTVTAVFTRLAANQLQQSLALTQKNEAILEHINQELILQERASQKRETETRTFLQDLQSLYVVNLELSRTESLVELYQRAVELGRSELDFDRMAVLLYDPQTEEMVGTFGTDEQGQIMDESNFRGPISPHMLKILNEQPRVLVRQNEALRFAGKEVGKGWNAFTLLWDGNKGVGWLTIDNLVRQEPLIPYKLEILILYGATLGRLITLKRQEEIMRSYAEELENSNRELEQFAYAASHDLQEPLRKIQTFAARLTTIYAEFLDMRGVDYLTRMQDAAERMQNLIENLLTLSRVTRQADTLTAVNFTAVNLTAVLQDVLDDLETRIEETQAIIHADPLPTIQADPTQMHQLFQNLLANAMKFNRSDSAPQITILSHITAQKEYVKITMRHNGIGFEEKYNERIFAPFQRLHNRDTYEGSGIGLALCKRIVERHNGRITANGIVNEGATFTIILPINQS